MAIPYIGGKSSIGKWIVSRYPTNIETYCEPFSGAFWCFFKMDLTKFKSLKRVVYNDINKLNYNLFKCIQNPSELQKVLDKIPVQQLGIQNTPTMFKENFIRFQSEIFKNDLVVESPDYDLAAKYVYVITQIFSGAKPEKSNFIDLKGKYRSKYLSFRDKLSNQKWVDHFLKITDVRCEDYSTILTEFDGPNTLFYVDPPYVSTEHYYSNQNFIGEDHNNLSESLHNIVGKFCLSYYEFPELHEWYPKSIYSWDKMTFNKAAGAKKGVPQNKSEEILISKLF